MGPLAGEAPPRMNVDKELARLAKRYALTDDQKTQVRAILEDEKQKMDALAKDSSQEPEDMYAKTEAIRGDESARISAVLKADQRAKFESDEQKRQRREKDEGGPDGPPPDGGGPGGGPPPA